MSVQASKPEKVIQKYFVEEFWSSLYYQSYNEDNEYDGFLHIISNIDGREVKIPIKDIVHEAAKYQHKS